MGNPRIPRLEERIKEEIALILQGEIKDPRLGFVSVTRVELNRDMSKAKIFVSVMEESEEGGSMAALESGSGFIRRLLGESLEVRHIPEVEFFQDHNLEHVSRVEELLQQIHKEQPGEAAQDPDDSTQSGTAGDPPAPLE